MSYDPEDVKDPGPKLRIREVVGGNDRDKADLETCYFQQVGNPGNYCLFEIGDGHQIPTAPSQIQSGEDFQFIRGGTLWTVSHYFNDGKIAKGRWFNTRDASNDDGSFQAQAGPTVEGEESASSVSA